MKDDSYYSLYVVLGLLLIITCYPHCVSVFYITMWIKFLTVIWWEGERYGPAREIGIAP